MADVKHIVVVSWAFTPGIETTYRDVVVPKFQGNRVLEIRGLASASDAGSFTTLGEPDLINHSEPGGRVSVEVIGFDTYDPATGRVTPDDAHQIAAWMIDTDHDAVSCFSTLTYVPTAHAEKNLQWLLKELGKAAEPNALDKIVSTRSQPFPRTGNPVAVKIVTTTGAEMTALIHPEEVSEAAGQSPG